MIKFIMEHDPKNQYDNVDIIMTIPHSGATKHEVIEVFQTFLKACGYSVEGIIDEVEPYEATKDIQDA